MKDFSVHVFSDSFGETGEQLARCALSQFGLRESEVIKHSHVCNLEVLERELKILNGAKNIIVLYTIVHLDVVGRLKEFCREREFKCIDMLNPLIDLLEVHVGRAPRRESGLYRRLDEKYFKRIEAIEFAVKYDDGKDIRGIQEADLVILGVSRTSKTPLSIYLGNKKKIKVINIPLVPEVEVPKEVFEIPKRKVIGLTNSIEMLNKIREQRLKTIGFENGSTYSSMGRIIEELDYAEGIMKRVGCPVVDVSEKAIEESAEIIMEIARENGLRLY